MKKFIILLLLSGQAAAHDGGGTANALLHVHGADYAGAGLVMLALLVFPLLRRLWQRGLRA